MCVCVCLCGCFSLYILFQFDGPTETAISLFCILNGDDLFNTFTGVEVSSNSIQLFSKLYLIVFMFLFIYIIISLFIGIFNHAYESLSVSVHSLVCVSVCLCKYVSVCMHAVFLRVSVCLCVWWKPDRIKVPLRRI